MSTVLSAPPTDEHARTRAAVDRRGGRWRRFRVEWRLAARQARRAGTTSLLVVALIAIPMMLVTGAGVFGLSHIPTAQQLITAELGQTQSWMMIVGGEDPSRFQEPGDPYWFDVEREDDWNPVHPEQTPPADLDGLVPEGELLRVADTTVKARTPGGVGNLRAFVGDAADVRLDGRYELLDGRRPADASEVSVSPGALERLDAGIGDTLTLTDPVAELTIVGVMKQTTDSDSEQSIVLAEQVRADAEAEAVHYFSPDWQPTAADLPALNQAGVIAYARDLVAEHEAARTVDPGSAWAVFAIGSIITVFVAYLVILLAGAGFAVSARRQQRSLAVAASVGADRGSVFRIVLLQGTVLGLVGGVLGAVVGTALAYPALVLFDSGSLASFAGFNVPWWGLAAVVLFAAAVGTASALVPARAATRGDVLASLRGSRKPPRVRVDRPLWGSLLIAGGIAATVIGGLGLAALNAADSVDYGDPLRTLFLVLIVAGPLLFQIGVIVAGHWILSLIARLASRLGLSIRIAARDAAANPARIVPAFAAIGACVFIASFAMTSVGVTTTATARVWGYQAPVGSVVVDVWAPEDDDAIREMAREALEATGPDAIGAVRHHVSQYTTDSSEPQDLFATQVQDYVDCDDIEQGMCETAASALFSYGSPEVIAPADLATALGVQIPESALSSFAEGGALVLDPKFLDGDEIEVNRLDREETDSFYQYWTPSKALPVPLESWRVPAEHVRTPVQLQWSVILSPAAAESMGYHTMISTFVGSFDEPPAQEAIDRLALAADQPWGSGGGFTYTVENGPPGPEGWLWLILGAAGVLVLGAGGVALGLARVERRPDDATLAAVGATGGIRRRIAFWQAVIIVGIGSVTGTVAGIIPMWGITMMSTYAGDEGPSMLDTPWLWLALLAIGLPLAIAVVSWLVPTRRPDLTRRTVIA